MKQGFVAAAVLAGLCLSGCVATKLTLSDDRIARHTASVLGVNPQEVRISNRQNSGGSTSYVAEVRGRRFACVIGGGSISTYGMVSPPNCNQALGTSAK